nr:MAG: nonstructural protein [Microvirus sp.]
MEHKVYSIRDAKGEIFHTPFYSKTHGEAERNFNQLVNDNKSTVSQFPDDYDLYYLGTYNDQTGLVSSLDTPQHLIKAVQVRKNQ